MCEVHALFYFFFKEAKFVGSRETKHLKLEKEETDFLLKVVILPAAENHKGCEGLVSCFIFCCANNPHQAGGFHLSQPADRGGNIWISLEAVK